MKHSIIRFSVLATAVLGHACNLHAQGGFPIDGKGWDVSTSLDNVHSIVAENATITSAIATIAAVSNANTIEFGCGLPLWENVSVSDSESDTVDLLAGNGLVTALALVEDPPNPGRSAGFWGVSAVGRVSVGLNSGSTNNNTRVCTTSGGCWSPFGVCEDPYDGSFVVLDIANGVPFLALSYDVSPTDPADPYVFGLTKQVAIDTRTTRIDLSCEPVTTSGAEVRSVTFVGVTLSSSSESITSHGMHVSRDDGANASYGFFDVPELVGNGMPEGYVFSGTASISLMIEAEHPDTYEVAVSQDAFPGFTGDTNLDGFVDCADRSAMESAIASGASFGSRDYLPRYDHNVDLQIDMIDLLQFKTLYFASSTECGARVDVNCDGVVNQSDTFAWVQAFQSGNVFADTNNDGVVNQSDFFAFIMEYGNCI